MEKRGRNSLLPKLKKHPWLMFSHGENLQRQTFYSVTEDHYYIRVIPELRNKEVVSCSNGWLALEDVDWKDCFLLNIVSMEMIELPLIDKSSWRKTFIIRSPPNDPNCKLLIVAEKTFLMWQRGDKEFVRKDFCFETRYDNWSYSGKVIIHQEKIYVMTCHLDFYVADLEEPIIRFTNVTNNKVPRMLLLGDPGLIPYLISLGDEILSVQKIYSSKCRDIPTRFEIFRFDQLQHAWMKVKNIGKQAIFLSNDEARICPVSHARIKENSIYFTYLRTLYVFDLADESLSASLPCPNVPKDYSVYYHWIWS